MTFEIDSLELSAEQKEGLTAHIEATAGTITKGLKAKNAELLGKLSQQGEQVTNLEAEMGKITTALGERSLEDVSRTFEALDEGKYKEALGAQKYDEAFEMRLNPALKAERAKWEKENLPDIKRLEELEAENAQLNARTREFGIAQRVDEIFSRLEDHRPTARDDVRQLALSTLKVDENHVVYVPDEAGDPRVDRHGNPIDLDGWIESLRDTKEHYFKDPVGTNAKGGRVVGHNGFGTGITSKKGADAQVRSTFMAAARKAGKSPMQEWNNLPDD